MKIFRLLAFLALCLSSIVPAGAAPLSFEQVAQHAYDAGFRGGSLTYAIAVADAESGRDPLAVSNNYAITLANGTPVMLANGKQRIEGVPAIGPAAMVPVLDPTDPAAVRAVPEFGLFGRPVSHCRGLWQMNDALENPHNQPLDPFDPGWRQCVPGGIRDAACTGGATSASCGAPHGSPPGWPQRERPPPDSTPPPRLTTPNTYG